MLDGDLIATLLHTNPGLWLKQDIKEPIPLPKYIKTKEVEEFIYILMVILW